ncbi:MAG: hypothetical protein J6T02_04345 [Bacteroidales bacterium]|nr:hypothetical protein [Bacteroidales bacterium]
MSVKKFLLFAAAVVAAVTVFSCKKFNNDSSDTKWNLPGYSFIAFEDQVPTNMEESSITVYFHVPPTENPDVKFGFFLSNNPSVPEDDRTEVIWDSKMKTDLYESAVQIKATFRELDCNKTYYYKAFYSLDGNYWSSEIKSFIPGCVELGPGIKWAVCNLGAITKIHNGNYYAWGETSPKTNFTSDNYTYTDTPDVLPLSADAARKKLGGHWRLPTKAEVDKIFFNPDQFTLNKVSGGVEVISKIAGYEGRSIYLPCGGIIYNGSGRSGDGSECRYLCSSRYKTSNTEFWGMSYFNNAPRTTAEQRYWGYTIRPILSE